MALEAAARAAQATFGLASSHGKETISHDTAKKGWQNSSWPAIFSAVYRNQAHPP